MREREGREEKENLEKNKDIRKGAVKKALCDKAVPSLISRIDILNIQDTYPAFYIRKVPSCFYL